MNNTIKEIGGLEFVKGDPVAIGPDTANKGKSRTTFESSLGASVAH